MIVQDNKAIGSINKLDIRYCLLILVYSKQRKTKNVYV